MSAFQASDPAGRIDRYPSGGRNSRARKIHQIPFEILGKVVTICGKSIYPFPTVTMGTACKHPRVRIVSRHEDTEYVECLECGDVFDSEEFHDMEIEESAEKEKELEDE